MKKQHSNRNILLGLSLCIILAITAMAFQDPTKVNNSNQQTKLDTVPKNNDLDININLRGLDESIKKSMEQVEKSMKDIDWNKMSKQIEQGMKQIDMAKLELDMKNSIKSIDWDKMKQEINKSMKEIDMSKMKLDIEKEMKHINSDEMKKSLEESKKINFDGLKKEMENVRKEMELNKDHFKMDMEKFKIDMEKVKAGMRDVKDMTDEMEKDGLLNKNESNSIEYKDKELFINGKKQSREMTEKYRKYFKGDNFKFKFNGN